MENRGNTMEMFDPNMFFKLGPFSLDEGPSHSETPVFFESTITTTALAVLFLGSRRIFHDVTLP